MGGQGEAAAPIVDGAIQSFWKRRSADDQKDEAAQIMRRALHTVRDAGKVHVGGTRARHRMGVPVADEM